MNNNILLQIKDLNRLMGYYRLIEISGTYKTKLHTKQILEQYSDDCIMKNERCQLLAMVNNRIIIC